MAKYWSASKLAFYDDTVISQTDMPGDVVQILETDYQALMAEQDAGKVIVAGEGGYPTAIEQTCGQCTCLQHDTLVASSETLGHVKIGPSVKVGADGTIDVGSAFGEIRAREATEPDYGTEAAKEQDVVLTTKDASGNAVIQMPITRAENVEGAIRKVNNQGPDENGNVSVEGYTHPKSGVTAGTYNSVTVDDKGHVTAGEVVAGYTHPKSGVTAGTYNSVTVNDEGHVTAGSTVAVVKKVNKAQPDAEGNVTVDLGVTSVNGNSGEVELFTAGTDDLTAGESALETGKLYFMYE